MTREEELRAYFKDVDDDKKHLAYDTIEEYILFLDRINELKKMPYIRFDPKRPERQELTPAAKLIKDYSNIIDAKRKTLLTILYRVDATAADTLLAGLAELEI
ncbi:MAG: hypothetical protein MJZ20_08440 [Bacteroidaceae bacterium]|nr:hypothetical protein [Bacteroidaceae bacterium]